MGNVLVRASLRKWDVEFDLSCILCVVELESLEHIFFDYVHDKQLWSVLASGLRFEPRKGQYDVIRK